MKILVATAWYAKLCRSISSHWSVMVVFYHAIQVSFHCCLPMNVSHQHHHPLAVASEDLACCYNQIVHYPASLACQCLHMIPQVMATIFTTIQLMKFYLHTAYGDSATFWVVDSPNTPSKLYVKRKGWTSHLAGTVSVFDTHDSPVQLPKPAFQHHLAFQHYPGWFYLGGCLHSLWLSHPFQS